MTQTDQKENSILNFLIKAFFVLIPFGLPLFARLVPSDFMILASGFIILLLNKKKIKLCAIDGLFLIFLGISCFGKEIFFYPRSYIFEILSISFLYFSFKIVSGQINNESQLYSFIRFLRLSLITMLAINTVAILFKLAGVDLFNTFLFNPRLRLKGFFSLPNQLGITILLLTPLIFYKGEDGILKRMFIFSMILLNTTEVGARGIFWISLFEIFVIEMFIFKEAQMKRNALKAAILLATIIAVFCVLSGEFSLKRSLGQVKNFPMAYDESRVSTFRKAVNTMPDWFSGYGLGCFKNKHPFEIHNLPLSILVETGVFGFAVAFICYIIATWPIFLRNISFLKPKFHPCLTLSILIGLLVGMLHNLTTNRSFWLILALSYSISQITAIRNSDPKISIASVE